LLTDYVFVLGADSLLPKTYLASLLYLIKSNSNLKVVSGCIDGEAFDDVQPRGSGRLVDASWWRSVNGLRYPVVWGWEAWLHYKALSQGFEARSFKELTFKVTRKSGISLHQIECHGYSMNVLGYFWLFALARCISRGPRYGKAMLIGWIHGHGIEKLDVANYVYNLQRKRLFSKMKHFVMEKTK
jgi:hypothetical protein